MIGIIPAAGKAERMLGLPKMLLPVPPQTTLIARMRDSIMALKPRKICIGSNGVNMALLEPFDRMQIRLYYAYTATMSETVLEAQRFTQSGERVLFGMPDTYVEDAAAFEKLSDALDGGADVAVGLFVTPDAWRHKRGMCRVEGDRVVEVIDKPQDTDLFWAWGVLAWRPVFWQSIDASDTTVGYALSRAIHAGLNVRAVTMDGYFYDCGTHDEYFRLIQKVTEVEHASI